jgi:hypothetical protein|tara:strand:+ start:3981 stop:4103 length:123 start_codon:yes stop_codon:yes gene_type:complete
LFVSDEKERKVFWRVALRERRTKTFCFWINNQVRSLEHST